MTNPRVFFSTVQPSYTTSPTALEQLSSVFSVHDTQTGKAVNIAASVRTIASVYMVLSTPIVLNEVLVLDVAQRLVAARVFDKEGRTLTECNVLGAVEAYWETMQSVGRLSSYQSLYAAFEKAVNADGQTTGPAFAAKAATMTGLENRDVETLRSFYNRIKHVAETTRHLDSLTAGEQDFPRLAHLLKQGADQAILARI